MSKKINWPGATIATESGCSKNLLEEMKLTEKNAPSLIHCLSTSAGALGETWKKGGMYS